MADNNLDPLGGLISGGLAYGLASQNGLNLQQIGQAGQQGLQGLQSILSGQNQQGVSQNVLGSYNNPFLDQNIAAGSRSLNNQFQNQILPSINDTFSNAGSLGSGRQAALTGTATQNFTNKLADIDAQQRSNAYNAAYTAAVNAGGQNFAAQQNAAQRLYSPATSIAQDAPWLQGVVGGAAGAGLASFLGGNGGGGGAAGGILNGVTGAIGQGASKLLSSLGLSASNSAPTTGPAGEQIYQLSNGGTLQMYPDGTQAIIQNGQQTVYDPSGNPLNSESTQVLQDQFAAQDLENGASQIADSGSNYADIPAQDSWFDSADWSSWF